MKTLIVMRHAKAEPASEGQEDIDRPLSAEGLSDAAALGRWLREKEYLPDLALVSAALRTRQTWETLGLEEHCPVREKRAFYNAAPSTLISAVSVQDCDTLLLVGHNPEIATVAQHPLRDTDAAQQLSDFPPGAIAVIGFDIESWEPVTTERGRLIDFVVPAMLVPSDSREN